MDQVKHRIREDKRPLYTQALEAIEKWIRVGHFKSGDRLPAESDLAEQLGITRPTLRRALGHLETRGLISRRQGIGTFVTLPAKSGFMGGLERLESFHSLAREAGLTPEIVETEFEIVPAEEQIAAALSIEPGEDLIRFQIVHAVDGIRSIYLDDYFPTHIFSLEEITANKDALLDYFKSGLEDPLSYSRSEIFAIDADDVIASKLSIPEGKSVLHLVETHYTSTGSSLGMTFVYILSDHFRFYIVRKAH
jgi:GntR family transcriptional regulator